LKWRGIEFAFDDDCPSGHLYCLNFEHLKLQVDDAGDFDLGKALESINSPVFVSKLIFRGQLIVTQPRGLGRLTGIS
jgi:hypothetical protein